MKVKKIKREVKYYIFPIFNPYTEDGILIKSRYVVCQSIPSLNDINDLMFTIEDICKFEKYDYTKKVFVFSIPVDKLPPGLKIMASTIALDHICNKSSELFMQTIFHDIFNNNEIMKEHFPDAFDDSIPNGNDIDIVNKLLEVQRRIRDGKTTSNQQS